MASAVIGSLRAILGIDTALFDKGLGDAVKGLAGVGKSMKTVGKSMSAFVTAPILGFGALTAKTAGDFEASMNRVDAATGASSGEFQAMRNMAIQLGADTSFAASEAADAMEMLAKNGLDAGQILDGAVAASMQLAAASGSDLASAADVATSVMMNFGKEANELGGLVDGITGVLLESKFGFEDYTLAIGQAGGVAGNLGVSFEDFNAVIAATSSAFSSGSDAGTSFKTFLTRLVPSGKPAAEAMNRLGLSFFDAAGNMKSMSAIAGELQTKMSGLSDQDLNEAMKDIFGVDAMRTGIMLMQQGAKGIDDFKARIGEASAEEQAAARLKGFNGEMEKLSGAFETLQIAIADSGLLETITGIVAKVADWITVLAQSNPELLKWGTIIAAAAAAIGPVVLSLGLMATGLSGLLGPIALVSKAVMTLVAASGPIGLLALAVGGIVTVWQNWDTIGPILENLYAASKEWLQNKLGAVLTWVGDKVSAVTGFFADMYDQVVGHSFVPDMVTEIGEWMGKLASNMVAPAADAADRTSSAFQGVGQSVVSSLNSIFDSVTDGSFKARDAIAGLLQDMAKLVMNNAFKALVGGIMGAGLGGSAAGAMPGVPWSFGAFDPTGFANGGQFKVGGAGGIDSQLVQFRASPNETVAVTKPGQDSGGRGPTNISVQVQGANGDQHVVDLVREGVRQGIAEYDKSVMPGRAVSAVNAHITAGGRIGRL